MVETQGMMTRRHATNGVDERCLDGLAQGKHAGIHKVCWGNKWMGSLDFEALNNMTS